MSTLTTYPNTADPIADLFNAQVARPTAPRTASRHVRQHEEFRWPTPAEVQAHMDAGRRLRAEHAARTLAGFGRLAGRAAASLVAALRWFGQKAVRLSRAE